MHSAEQSVKRIAFPFVGDTVGGSHVSACLLMQALPEFGYEPVALVHRKDGPLEEYLRDNGVEVRIVDLPFLNGPAGMSSIFNVIGTNIRNGIWLRKQNYHLIHANDGRMIHSWIPACRIAGIGGIAHRRTRWVQSRVSDRIHALAHHIVAISCFVLSAAPSFVRKKTSVVANPFKSPEIDREEARRTLEIVAGKAASYVMFVGTLQPQKRPDIFIETAALLKKKSSDIKFVMVGRETSYTEELLHMCDRYNLKNDLIFTGYRSDADMLLGGADLLIAPAENEGHGRVLVEAMSLGLPVVASASGGHLEVVEQDKTGFLVEPGNAEEFADATSGLLDDDKRRNIISFRARDWALEHFSQKSHARSISEIYNRLLR